MKRLHNQEGVIWRYVMWAWTVITLVLLYLPMLPPPIFSLSDKGVAHALSHPSLAAYGAIWTQPVLMQAIWNSLGVALVVGLVTPTLAVLAAMAVRELRIPRVVLLLTLLPLFIPGVSMGLATAFLFERVGLEPSLLSIYIVNVLWALPFAFLVVLTAMSNFDTVQLEAAWILGSNRWHAFWDVEFPSIRPGVIGAATFSMILVVQRNGADLAGAGGQQHGADLHLVDLQAGRFVADPLCSHDAAHSRDFGSRFRVLECQRRPNPTKHRLTGRNPRN